MALDLPRCLCFLFAVDELEQLKAKYERLSQLHQVSQVINSTLDSKKAFELIIAEAVRLMRASSGSLVLVNPTSGFLEMHAVKGLPRQGWNLKLRPGEGITGWVVQWGRPARVGKVQADKRYIAIRPEVRSELAVPMEVEGQIRGALNVDSDREEAFTADDEQLLSDLARLAAGVIHNTWLYEQIRVKARLFETLVSVGQTINSTEGLDEALKVITREATMLMAAKMSSLLLLDESREWLDLKACYGAGPSYLNKPRLAVADSLLGVVARRKRPLQVENVQVSSLYQNIEIARIEGLVSVLSVPLVFNEQPLGTLSVYTGQPHSFSNEEIRILSALADLSAIAIEKARLYERVVDMEEQLRQSEKLSALGLLAAEVAHEIRNPLTVMNMLFHSLDLQFPPSDPRNDDVRIIADKMGHLNKIVDHVLDFARSNEPRPIPVNLNQLVENLRLLLRHKFNQNQIKLTFKLDSHLPLVLGDIVQLEQAFLNLSLNAMEAMPSGGELTITTRFERNPDLVVIQFQDTGIGMSEEQQRKIFSSFLKSTKNKGSGLGLAIVARIVEGHHGQISVQSLPRQGTNFRITFLPAPHEA